MSTTTRVSGVPGRLADQGIGGGDCRLHPRPSPPSRSVSLANPLADRVRNLSVPTLHVRGGLPDRTCRRLTVVVYRLARRPPPVPGGGTTGRALACRTHLA